MSKEPIIVVDGKEVYDFLRGRCQASKCRVTPQTRVVYNFLQLRKTKEIHPTAEEIHLAVKEELPDITLAAVYAILRKFKEMHILREINCGDGKARFDADFRSHHHLWDDKKGTLENVRLLKRIPIPKLLAKRGVREIRVMYVI